MMAQLENEELKAEGYCDQMMVLKVEQIKRKHYDQGQNQGQWQMGHHSGSSGYVHEKFNKDHARDFKKLEA